MLSYLNKEYEADLPSFISVGGANGARGPGFLGMKFAPFTVQNPGQPPENIRPPQDVDAARMQRRADMFGRLETGFMGSTHAEKDAAKAHHDLESRGTTGSSILIP